MLMWAGTSEVTPSGSILLRILNFPFSFISRRRRSKGIEGNSNIFIIMVSNTQKHSEFYSVAKSKSLTTSPCFLEMHWHCWLWRCSQYIIMAVLHSVDLTFQESHWMVSQASMTRLDKSPMRHSSSSPDNKIHEKLKNGKKGNLDSSLQWAAIRAGVRAKCSAQTQTQSYPACKLPQDSCPFSKLQRKRQKSDPFRSLHPRARCRCREVKADAQPSFLLMIKCGPQILHHSSFTHLLYWRHKGVFGSWQMNQPNKLSK